MNGQTLAGNPNPAVAGRPARDCHPYCIGQSGAGQRVWKLPNRSGLVCRQISGNGTMTFISEPIHPVTSGSDTRTMEVGAPGLPGEFTWRDQTLRVSMVLRTWRETGPCSHGSSEQYARKHWFEVETVSHGRAKIYFERQARGKNRTRRWWLFSIEKN